MPESSADFAKSFKSFMDQMNRQAPREEPPIVASLRAHFAADPAALPVLSHSFASHDHANLQLAIDAWAELSGRTSQVLGVVSDYRSHQRLSLPTLATGTTHGRERFGPVEFENITLADDATLACINSGLLLLCDGDDRLAVLVQGPTGHRAFDPVVTVQVMAPTREAAERYLIQLRSSIRDRNVYRGRIVSLDWREHAMTVNFHRLPAVPREQIILPEGLLERVERHTVRFSELRDRLKAAGRHLKRGLLLYGPPGTGKTFTAMHLAGRMEGRTVLLVTGLGQALIEQTCQMARALEPATVIMEDVDLIGASRDYNDGRCTSPLLFELLNQMDGLAEDVDILFILTTNRPDIIEPALAARPGRIDQAIEIPLPDADCRRRLLGLYAAGLELDVKDMERVVARTHGASAAFIKELMRRAALFAADRGPRMIVTDSELDEALHELLLRGDSLTRKLLGFDAAAAT